MILPRLPLACDNSAGTAHIHIFETINTRNFALNSKPEKLTLNFAPYELPWNHGTYIALDKVINYA